MALDLWLKDDVERILAGVLVTMNAASSSGASGASVATVPAEVEAYRCGFADALFAVSVSFGVTVPRVGDGRSV
jgi:hypothetical protein